MENPMKMDDLGGPLFKTLIFCFFDDTVDNCEILYQLIGGLSHYFEGFNHPG
jgi:hypothetical protein